MRLTQKQVDRFWSKVDIRGENECWIWKASKTKGGYGQVSINDTMFVAHRVAFLIQYGHLPFPNGLHSCDNRACCNPKHIHEGTHQDNSDEMVERDRQSRGEKHGMSRLTEAQVLEIHGMDGSHRQIAKKYGIAYSQVYQIKNHLMWRHLWQKGK